ncbi:MAG: recombinase family protein, partial [Defluviitaleaceae bacterium]|nr:recombinase family protein [Defluviitaleaceae bacterium]
MHSQNETAAGGLLQALTDSMTPKLAVSYLRVSSAGQASRGGGDDEGFSIPAQREANKRKALSMGAMVGKEFVDRGASARSADRPELKRMLEYIKENKERVDYLIVHKVDRLARNRGDDVDITRALGEAGVQLVSASESIDNTPSGMLLHGIMSSIAEFYSRNLSTEVKKGLYQKAKGGGTPNKAPIGYKNIRDVDEAGRRNSRVEIDPERAPLIKLAYTEYATNKWSINSLAKHLATLGLGTPAKTKLPAKLINKKMLREVLRNPYYKGIVTYNSVKYQGRHTPIIDEATWDKVQELLRSNVNGERERIHHHYLKSTVYCGKCGARLIICNARSRSGTRYPYFVCSARNNKRNDCNQRALLIDEVAEQVARLYERVSFTPEFRAAIQGRIGDEIDKQAEESRAELDQLKLQKDKLEREQRKLLQAHYADAIPLALLKDEQERIGKSLKGIEATMNAHKVRHIEMTKNLNDVFKLLEDCGRVYRMADDYEKRCFNQALFERVRVYDNLTVDADYADPYDLILDPAVFELKGSFERNIQNKEDGRPIPEAHLSLENILDSAQTTNNFFTAGSSKSIL